MRVHDVGAKTASDSCKGPERSQVRTQVELWAERLDQLGSGAVLLCQLGEGSFAQPDLAMHEQRVKAPPVKAPTEEAHVIRGPADVHSRDHA